MQIPAMQFTVTEIQPRVYHIEFETQRDLAHSMMRLQEYYEGVDESLRGNYFTLEEFLHHFTNEHGEFKYAHMWSGFNVPGQIVINWFELFGVKHNGLTAKENQVMTQLNSLSKGDAPWYLIATSKRSDSKNIVKHELAHARFYLSEPYRLACGVLINKIEPFELEYMRKCLIDIGYAEMVLDDEIQAYMSTSKKSDLKYCFGKLANNTLKLVDEFRRCFKKKDSVTVGKIDV